MTARFYIAWAVAAALALVLPVAVPYAVWPPARFDEADSSGDCAGIAKAYAAEATHRAASLWPVSVRVEQCEGDLSSGLDIRATVEAHGPYGIPFARATVTPRGFHWSGVNGGETFGLIALLGGVVIVSFPFALVLLRQAIRQHPAPAV